MQQYVLKNGLSVVESFNRCFRTTPKMPLKSHLIVCNWPIQWQLSMWHYSPTNKIEVFSLPHWIRGLPYSLWMDAYMYSKTCVKQPLSKGPKNGFQDWLSLIVGKKYCRMLQREHSAILSTFIKLPIVNKTFVCLFLSGCFTQVILCLFNSLLVE